MNQTAHAIVFAGKEQVEMRTIHIPPLRPDEVLVRTEVTGVSIGTDRWIIQGRYRDVNQRYPFVYGYQRVGRVEEIGSQVSLFKPGDRVFVGLSGCRLDLADGLGEVGGAYTSLGVVQETDAVLIPEDVPAAVAALCGLAAISLKGIQLSRVGKGDLVLVLGLGMIGQFAAQLCRLQGARVIATDLLQGRVEKAQRYSADIAINTKDTDLVEVLKRGVSNLGPTISHRENHLNSRYEIKRWEEAGGYADVVIDTVGLSSLFATHLDLLRREGRLCLQGYFVDPIDIDFHAAHMKRASIICPGGMDLNGYLTVLDLARSGSLQVEPLVTHSFRASESVKAFKTVLEKPEEVLGVTLDWSI